MTEPLLFDDDPNQKPKRGGLSAGSWVLLAGLAAMVIVFAVQLSRQNATRPPVGATAPDFTLTTFDGDPLQLSDYRGEIVVLNFWGSWCPPCHEEAPDLQIIHEDYADQGVQVIGVNWLDVERAALEFIDNYDWTFPNGPDIEERIVETYKIPSAPETYLIGPDGVVQHIYLGAFDYDDLTARLDALLAERDV
jgi:cytochrome c biogenesis protein CcmG/thiol:disulfide interchange protein DsbE